MSIPVLVMYGEKDNILGKEYSLDIYERIQNSYLKSVSGGKHTVVINKSENIVESIEEFLKSNKFVS